MNDSSSTDGFTDPKRYSAPMPWIGVYIVGASIVCSLAMVADLIRGLFHKRLWVPCRFFTLNAVSLTVLAVAVKIPTDLNTPMRFPIGQFAKVSGIAFMTTCMINMTPSLGTMTDKEILANMSALGILVITLAVNVIIEVSTTLIYRTSGDAIVAVFLMLLQFVLMVVSSLTVPTTKKHLDIKYGQLHNMMQSEGRQNQLEESTGNMSIAMKLEEDVKKYAMMTDTANPQFVLARSATSLVSCIICLYYFLSYSATPFDFGYFLDGPLNGDDWHVYGLTINLICLVQSFGIFLGTIPSAMRWFPVLKFRCSKKINKCFTAKVFSTTFKIEKYWTERLQNWKTEPLTLPIRIRGLKKLLHNTRSLVLSLCIAVLIVIVVGSKIIQQSCTIILSPFFLGCHYSLEFLKKYRCRTGSNNLHIVELDLTHYVLHLEGEEELPQWFPSSTNTADWFIKKGRKQQDKGLNELLQTCTTSFTQVVNCENDQIEPLHSKTLPSCWSLTVVTLTSIAIALPQIGKQVQRQLIRRVTKALLYVKVVEQVLDNKGDLVNISDAANSVWLNVEVRKKWLTKDLQKLALEGKSPLETIRKLVEGAKTYVVQFMTDNRNLEVTDPLNFPFEFIAADSMYKIGQTILLSLESGELKANHEEVFGYISVMIADILGACLTNLPRAIRMKCFSCALEKREENVRDAARLLGETEEILKVLQSHELPNLDVDKRIYIDEWRSSLKQENFV